MIEIDLTKEELEVIKIVMEDSTGNHDRYKIDVFLSARDKLNKSKVIKKAPVSKKPTVIKK